MVYNWEQGMIPDKDDIVKIAEIFDCPIYCLINDEIILDERKKSKDAKIISKEFRTEKGLLQQELADICGVSRQTVNAIENNKYDPTLEFFFKLAKSLETTVDKLFIYE